MTGRTLLFHKPWGVLSQFTPEPGSRWRTLADHIERPGVYPAGRLDADSEGLLLLTDNGRLQQRLTDPAWGHWRRYLVQVEGEVGGPALDALRQGVMVQGRRTLPARAGLWGTPACRNGILRSATACGCQRTGWNWNCGRGGTGRCGA